MGQRRKAREFAVQTLYGLDFAEISGEFLEYEYLNKYPEILEQLIEAEKLDNSSTVESFADELVKNAIINREMIDTEIEKYSDNWRVDDIAHVDHCILKIAVYELLFTDTPAAVVINEAIEVSKKFSSEGSAKFLNGILDAIRREIKENELIEGSKA